MLQDSISTPLPKVEGTWFVKHRDGWKELEAPAASHPITPPPELLQQWMTEFYGTHVVPGEACTDLATRSAQWGADQELEACAAFVKFHEGESLARDLRKTRRPKPLSLKEQALAALEHLDDATASQMDTTEAVQIIGLALEQLDD